MGIRFLSLPVPTLWTKYYYLEQVNFRSISLAGGLTASTEFSMMAKEQIVNVYKI